MSSTKKNDPNRASRQNAANEPNTAATTTDSASPLLRASPSTTMYGATTAPLRPLLPHTQTVAATEEINATTPNFSRPILTRAVTTAAVSRPTTATARPGLLHRISSGIDLALELSTESSYAHRNRPAQPSH